MTLRPRTSSAGSLRRRWKATPYCGLIWVPEELDCETEEYAAPDGRAGRLCVGGGRVPVAGRVNQVLTVTPVDAAEEG